MRYHNVILERKYYETLNPFHDAASHLSRVSGHFGILLPKLVPDFEQIVGIHGERFIQCFPIPPNSPAAVEQIVEYPYLISTVLPV
jgi:hypothetical protein